MRMELGTGHGRETELCGSVTDVSRTPGAIRMAWVPPRTPNEPAIGSLCERGPGTPTLGEIVALNSGMRSRKSGTRALEMTTSLVGKLRH
jgi:hypothetical protein